MSGCWYQNLYYPHLMALLERWWTSVAFPMYHGLLKKNIGKKLGAPYLNYSQLSLSLLYLLRRMNISSNKVGAD